MRYVILCTTNIYAHKWFQHIWHPQINCLLILHVHILPLYNLLCAKQLKPIRNVDQYKNHNDMVLISHCAWEDNYRIQWDINIMVDKRVWTECYWCWSYNQFEMVLHSKYFVQTIKGPLKILTSFGLLISAMSIDQLCHRYWFLPFDFDSNSIKGFYNIHNIIIISTYILTRKIPVVKLFASFAEVWVICISQSQHCVMNMT